MRKTTLLIIPLLILGIVITLYVIQGNSSDSTTESQDEPGTSDLSNISSSTTSMNITSPSFSHNESIPSKYTCDGDNISPPLKFSDIPEGTKSLVLIMDDPDAPAGLWVHWLIWNIPSDTKELAEDSVPSKAVQGTTSFERTDYGGPCPPDNEHRYFFKLYALDATLDLEPSNYKEDLEKEMEGHILQKAELIGLYAR